MARAFRILLLAWTMADPLGAVALPLFARPDPPAPPPEARPKPTAAPDEDAPPRPPEPYPIPVLHEAIADTHDTLGQVQGDVLRNPDLKEIEAGLKESARSLGLLEATPEFRNPASLSMPNLRDQRQSWLRLGDRLGVMEKSLKKQAGDLERDRARVAELLGRWGATRGVLVERGAPAGVIRRVDALRQRLESLQGPIRDSSTRVLLSQSEAADQRVRVTEARKSIEKALAEAQERVFAQRGRPLWRLFAGRWWGPGLREDIGQTIRGKGEAARDYFRETPGALPWLLLTLALSLAASYWIRKRAAAFDAGSPARVLVGTRPLSSAWLLGMVLWTYGQFNAPRPVVELVMLSLCLPLYRVLAIWLPPSLRPSLAGLVVLLFLDRVRGLVSDSSPAGRVGVLVVSIGSVVLIFRSLRVRVSWAELRSRSRWIRLFGLVPWLVAAALALSILTNLTGQSQLSELLLRGSLASLFLGAVLTSAALIVESWLGLLGPIGRRLAGTAMASEAQRLHGLLVALTRAAAVTGWALVILIAFGISAPVFAGTRTLLFSPWRIGTLSLSLANLLGFTLALVAGMTTARLLRLLLDQAVLPGFDLPRGVPAAISTTVQYLVATGGVLVGIFALGIEASRFTILAGAIGVGVGFGLQNIVNNFVSGLILLYERPIQTGDTVEMGTLLGTVGRIGVRSSTVRTFDGAEVLVPNATLVSNEVTNWTLSDRQRRVEVSVGVSYRSDPRQVITLLEEVARSLDGVLADPAPAVLFQKFGDSSLDFSVRVWTPDFEGWLRLQSSLNVAIFEALARNGIEIPFPQRDVHLKSGVPPAAPPAAEGRGGEKVPPAPARFAGREAPGRGDDP